MAGLLGLMLAFEHFSAATKAVIGLPQPIPSLKSASPYIPTAIQKLAAGDQPGKAVD